MDQTKVPRVVDVVEKQGAIGGVIAHGKAKFPFAIKGTTLLTGACAQRELARGQWRKPMLPTREICNLAGYKTIGRDRKRKLGCCRVTVFYLPLADEYLALCQLPRSRDGYVERFRLLDPLVGFWLVEGVQTIQRSFREHGAHWTDREIRSILVGDSLDCFETMAKMVHKVRREQSFWHDMPERDVMLYAMTGW